jgi:adenylosuccinate lyase
MTPAVIPNVLASRYATKEMVAIFDPINKIIAERKFWITILRLQKAGGLLPIVKLPLMRR